MRSSFFIFVIGFVLGGTLGFGGLYTQVLQPAYQEVEQLERENGVMKDALNEAGSALREAAESLRTDSGPEPMSIDDITGTNTTRSISPRGVTPEGDEPARTTTRLDTTDRSKLASRLDSIASRLDKATQTDE